MNLQIKIFINKIKKYYKYILLQLLFVLIYILFLKITTIPITIRDFIIMIGEKKNNILGILFILYQAFVCMLITYKYYMYEKNNNNINIIMRVNSKEWIKNKISILTAFIVIYKLLYSLIVYIFFINIYKFPLKLITYNITKYIIIMLVLINILNNYKNKKVIIYITLLLLTLVIYFNNFFINIMFIIIMNFINIYTFNIKDNINDK